MKLFIIGGTGNISTPITKMIQGKGHDITLFNYDKMQPEWLLPEVKVINGNRTDLPKFEKQIFKAGNYNCVIDMICFEPEDAIKAIALFKGRTEQFIFCSTVDVYPKTVSTFPIDETLEIGASSSFPYAWKKVECERQLWKAHQDGAFQLTVIRPAATFNESWSPGVHSFGGQTYHLDRLLRGKPFILHGDGSSVWTAAYRDVTASAFLGAICNEKAYGQAYNANGDEMFTFKKMWLIIAKVMNAPEPDFVYIPTFFLSKMAPEESEWCVENFMYNNILDNSKAKRDLGFEFKFSYEEGVKLSIDYLTRHKLIENSDNFPFYDRIVQEWRSIEAEIDKRYKTK
ncbi:MAG: NAD-dependent epimerase/dehydratase family protein [Bacteroidota bacterium]